MSSRVKDCLWMLPLAVLVGSAAYWIDKHVYFNWVVGIAR
jgi:hypothetical protein